MGKWTLDDITIFQYYVYVKFTELEEYTLLWLSKKMHLFLVNKHSTTLG